VGSSAMSEQHHYARQAYRADIDGMRAIAIIVVVLYHAFPTKLHGGFVGVDIFFVISGYLISGIILRSVAAGGFDFLLFYARRVKRLFPALALVFAASLAFASCGGRPSAGAVDGSVDASGYPASESGVPGSARSSSSARRSAS